VLALALPGVAAAQAGIPGPTAPDPLAPGAADGAEAPPANALPELGEVFDAVNKAVPADDPETAGWSQPVKLAVVFTALALLPAMLVMMTSFTRIVIVLAFIRRALTTQNIPPTIAVIGLALFLTLFTMAPTLGRINAEAVQPYLADETAFEPAVGRGIDLLKEFMLRQTRRADLDFFAGMAGVPPAETAAGVPAHVAIPAFAVSEFRTAFEMGAVLFIPFLVIDLVVAGILLSAGMMMLPPAIVSMPFKIILFVLVDGWRLLAEGIVGSFNF
jgi:flagellar biosynthetic protein FliP